MNARRIVFYSPGWPPWAFQNGIATYVANLREPLAGFGFASRVLAGSTAQDTSDPDVADVRALRRTQSLSVKLLDRALYHLAPRRSAACRMGLELTAALTWVRRVFPFDLVEIEESFGFAEYVRRALDVPIVVRLHGPWFLNGPALGVREDAAFQRRVTCEGLTIARAAAVTAPSRDVLERVRQRYGLPLPGAEVIPCPGPVVPESQRWNGACCEANAVLFVGRFDRHKGGDLAIDAFRELAKEFPALQLWFVGPDRGLVDEASRTWDLPTYLEEHVPDGSARRRVQVLGAQTPQAISELRRRAFLTIVPSRYDNFPMTAVEALAFGAPIVASRAGGIPEIVRDGETGLTFRPGDFRDLAAKIRRLLTEPGLATGLAGRARVDFDTRFSPSSVARSTAAFYEGVLTTAAITSRGRRTNRRAGEAR